MVGKDADALWREAADNNAKGGSDLKSDDKFLVQTTVLDEAYFMNELKGQDEKAQSATLAGLWKTLTDEDKAKGPNEKKSIKSSKLTTKFSFPNNMSATTVAQTVVNATVVSEAAATATATPAGSSSAARPAHAVPPASATAALKGQNGATAEAALPAQSEAAFTELALLRKK